MTFRFFFYTIALSWLGFGLAAHVPALGNAVFLLAIFMPALVAIWLTGTTQGEAGLRALFARVLEWRVGLKWYVFAIGYMLAIRLAGAAIQRLATGTWPQFGSEPWFLIVTAIAISAPVQAGEEIGWRGYALPRLGAKFGYGIGSAILGAFWALWHLPVFFMLPGNANYGQSFPLFFAAVVPLSIAMGWMFGKHQGQHTAGDVDARRRQQHARHRAVGLRRRRPSLAEHHSHLVADHRAALDRRRLFSGSDANAEIFPRRRQRRSQPRIRSYAERPRSMK